MTAPAFRSARFWGQLLRRDVEFEIVRAEGTAPELVREGRKEKRGGRKRTVACEKEKEGGSSRQQDWTTAQTLQSFFCFSEGTDFLFSLPVSPSCSVFSRCLAMTLVDTLISVSTWRR